MTEVEEITLRPQKGPQETFLSTPADIAIYGGSAGGGKTFAILLETLRHVNNAQFKAVIFRRTYADVMQQGGIWSDTETIYPHFQARPNLSALYWEFPTGARIGFAHLQHEKDKLKYQGAQIPLICFDELTHFTESQFWYLMSRNRSTCGVQPYIRATTNPDSESWVAELIQWWWDPATGEAIPERSGVVRWFVRDGGKLNWFDSKTDALKKHPDSMPLSFTFVPARLEDNPALMEKDPMYKAKLMALPLVDRARLLGGNWKIKAAAGLYFKRDWFNTAHRLPDFKRIVRAWDLAGSKSNAKKKDNKLDYTAGALMGVTKDNSIYILDLKHFKDTPAKVREMVLATAQADKEQWGRVKILLPQDPAQAGADQADQYTRMLAGFNVRTKRPTGSKITRAEGLSAHTENGHVFLYSALWNDALITECEQFPDGEHDDIVDAISDGFNELINRKLTGGTNWNT